MRNVFDNPDPMALFASWMALAVEKEPSDPSAMCLATVDAHSQPSARIVLLRGTKANEFHFFTNFESRKGNDLAAQSKAALCFHWKSLLRQVRVEGTVGKLSPEISDQYFASRHTESQLGAWASEQSRVIGSRDMLIEKLEHFRKKFQGADIPRPPHWGGYCLAAHSIEFWQQGDFRLHDRELFVKTVTGWQSQRLSP